VGTSHQDLFVVVSIIFYKIVKKAKFYRNAHHDISLLKAENITQVLKVKYLLCTFLSNLWHDNRISSILEIHLTPFSLVLLSLSLTIIILMLGLLLLDMDTWTDTENNNNCK